MYFGILKGRTTILSISAILLGFFILFIFRNHILAILLPALLGWIICEKTRFRPVWVFTTIYILGILFFFGAKYVHHSLDFPAFVVEKRNDFNKLTGNTSIAFDKLEPSPLGFARQALQAFSLAAFRPYFRDVYKPIIVPAFIEMVLFWILLLFFIISKKKTARFDGFGFFVFIFSITLVFVIGFTVNNLGATVRYRSVIFPLIIPFILNGINFHKIKSIYKINK